MVRCVRARYGSALDANGAAWCRSEGPKQIAHFASASAHSHFPRVRMKKNLRLMA